MPKDKIGGKRVTSSNIARNKSTPKRSLNINNIKMPRELTKKQREVIGSIIERIPEFDFYGDNYEIKQFDISADKLYTRDNKDKYSVSVVAVTGMKGDEGTMASVLARKRRQFWVGDNGGIKVFSKNNKFIPTSRFDLLNKYYNH